MKICIIDFETTGVDSQVCEPVQFGYINALYIKSERRLAVLNEGSFLIKTQHGIPNADFHGITEELTEQFGVTPDIAGQRMANAVSGADVIVGHNILAFDRPIFERYTNTTGTGKYRYFDTLVDWIEPSYGSMKLKYLSLDTGYVHQKAHSALSDCHAVLHLLGVLDTRLALDSLIPSSIATPFVRMIAKVEYKDRELPKKYGYRWHADRKIWAKLGRPHSGYAQGLPFQIETETV